MEKETKKLYEQVRAQNEKVNTQYKPEANNNYTNLEFKQSDFIWLYLK